MAHNQTKFYKLQYTFTYIHSRPNLESQKQSQKIFWFTHSLKTVVELKDISIILVKLSVKLKQASVKLFHFISTVVNLRELWDE